MKKPEQQPNADPQERLRNELRKLWCIHLQLARIREDRLRHLTPTQLVEANVAVN